MTIIFSSFLILSGCENTDIGLATDAGIDIYKAATLNDDDVKLLAAKASAQADKKNRIAPLKNHYSTRLNRLIKAHYQTDGYIFNYKVYISDQINAFAMADGTIRVYSGLMDMLDDSELLFVMGHEMGHVVENHIKKKIMLAYAGSALRKGIASQNNDAGTIARSVLGGILEQLLNAQFSQQEEREADDYGITFLKNQGYDRMSAVSALHKLATLGNNHSFLASHPAPGIRAKRLQNQINSPFKAEKRSLFDRTMDLFSEIITWVKGFFD